MKVNPAVMTVFVCQVRHRAASPEDEQTESHHQHVQVDWPLHLLFWVESAHGNVDDTLRWQNLFFTAFLIQTLKGMIQHYEADQLNWLIWCELNVNWWMKRTWCDQQRRRLTLCYRGCDAFPNRNTLMSGWITWKYLPTTETLCSGVSGSVMVSNCVVFLCFRKPFSALAFSHDGKYLVTGEVRVELHTWEDRWSCGWIYREI